MSNFVPPKNIPRSDKCEDSLERYISNEFEVSKSIAVLICNVNKYNGKKIFEQH